MAEISGKISGKYRGKYRKKIMEIAAEITPGAGDQTKKAIFFSVSNGEIAASAFYKASSQ